MQLVQEEDEEACLEGQHAHGSSETCSQHSESYPQNWHSELVTMKRSDMPHHDSVTGSVHPVLSS